MRKNDLFFPHTDDTPPLYPRPPRFFLQRFVSKTSFCLPVNVRICRRWTSFVHRHGPLHTACVIIYSAIFQTPRTGIFRSIFPYQRECQYQTKRFRKARDEIFLAPQLSAVTLPPSTPLSLCCFLQRVDTVLYSHVEVRTYMSLH